MEIWRNHSSSLFQLFCLHFEQWIGHPEVWLQLPGLQKPFATSISWATFGGRLLERGWGTEQLRASAGHKVVEVVALGHPWPPPKTLNHKQIEQHGTTITNHVSVLKEHGFTFGTSFFVDTPSSPTSCRSFSSGMSTPHWWATGEQWAHTLPKDLLGNLCTWAPWVVRLGVECRCMG